MALAEKMVFDRVSILEDGQIEVRRARIITDDGNEIARTFHRSILEPDMDPALIQNQKLRAIAQLIWDAATVTAYKEKKNKPGPGQDRVK